MADLIIPKVWEGKEICICVTEERAVFVYDKEQDKFIDTGETAMELPPHGRLIDADAEIKAWEQTKIVLKECDQKRTFAFKEACIAAKVLSDALTVLEANNG